MLSDFPYKLPLLYEKVFRKLKFHSEAGYVDFNEVKPAIGRLELNHDEQVEVMKELERLGLVSLVNYKGWMLKSVCVDNKTDPILAEFGHQCNGCAKYPCEKVAESKNGEPAGDCWEYERKEEP